MIRMLKSEWKNLSFSFELNALNTLYSGQPRKKVEKNH